MIALHSISLELGKGALRQLVLDNISWVVPPRSRFIILGHKGTGKTSLLRIIGGSLFPTEGWVERRGSICPNRGLVPTASVNMTPRQLAGQLARLYHQSPSEIIGFASRFAGMDGAMDFPIKMLPRPLRRRLDYALIYAIPFNYYLFDNGIGPNRGEFGELCRQAYNSRCQDAGMILTTSSSRIARRFDGIGGVLHGGKLTFFDTVEEAISVFDTLPPPPTFGLVPMSVESDDEEEEEWL